MNVTRRSWLGLAGVAAAGASGAFAAPADPRPRIAVSGHGDRDPGPLLAALGDYAAAERAAFGLPALTIGVAVPGGGSATIVLGDADLARGIALTPDRLFQIGSISKSMAALCLFRLAGEGRVDLDAPALTVAPDLPLPATGITIAQLLNHSSGLPDDPPLFPRVNGNRLWTGFPGGSRFAYSNIGFELLGLIVARVAGTTYGEALQALVLGPLGMTATKPLILTRDRAGYADGYVPFGDRVWFPGGRWADGPWYDFTGASGSVASTPADMARYAAFLARVGAGDGAPLFTPALARRFATPTILAPAFGPDAHYAAGIATIDVDGRQCLHHTGGMITFRSAITVDPIAGGGVFASTNCGGSEYRPRAVTRYGVRLLRAWVERRPLPPPPQVAFDAPLANAADYAGRFVAADGATAVVTANGGRLTVVARDPAGGVATAATALTAVGTDEFTADDDGLAAHNFWYAATTGPRRELWWGGRAYGRDAAPAAAAVPARLRPLVGQYVSSDPWAPGVSVVARGARLIVEGAGEIVPAADGSWRYVDPAVVAERLWFDGVIDGRAQRVSLSGSDVPRLPVPG